MFCRPNKKPTATWRRREEERGGERRRAEDRESPIRQWNFLPFLLNLPLPRGMLYPIRNAHTHTHTPARVPLDTIDQVCVAAHWPRRLVLSNGTHINHIICVCAKCACKGSVCMWRVRGGWRRSFIQLQNEGKRRTDSARGELEVIFPIDVQNCSLKDRSVTLYLRIEIK